MRNSSIFARLRPQARHVRTGVARRGRRLAKAVTAEPPLGSESLS